MSKRKKRQPEVNYETQQKAKAAYLVCHECGLAHGRGLYDKDGNHKPCSDGAHTARTGRCGICQRRKTIMDFRHYGYAKYE